MLNPVSQRPAPMRPFFPAEASAPSNAAAMAPHARPTPQLPLDRFTAASTAAAEVRAPAETSRRPADGLLAFEELSAGQQALLGDDGAAAWGGLDARRKAAFIVLTERFEGNGIDLGQMRLKGGPENGIRATNFRVDMLFEPDPAAMAGLRDDVEAAFSRGDFLEEQPSDKFHGGMCDFGGRENRKNLALQIGFGPEGVFVDMDRYNPMKGGIWNQIKHYSEIVTPGTIDFAKVAPELGVDIHSKL